MCPSLFMAGPRKLRPETPCRMRSRRRSLLPSGGIRPVKGTRVPRCHDQAPCASAKRPNCLCRAGAGYRLCGRFEAEVRKHASLAHWIPGIPPEAIRAAFESADVVLNTSSSKALPTRSSKPSGQDALSWRRIFRGTVCPFSEKTATLPRDFFSTLTIRTILSGTRSN